MLHLLYGSIVFLFWRVHMSESSCAPPALLLEPPPPADLPTSFGFL